MAYPWHVSFTSCSSDRCNIAAWIQCEIVGPSLSRVVFIRQIWNFDNQTLVVRWRNATMDSHRLSRTIANTHVFLWLYCDIIRINYSGPYPVPSQTIIADRVASDLGCLVRMALHNEGDAEEMLESDIKCRVSYQVRQRKRTPRKNRST